MGTLRWGDVVVVVVVVMVVEVVKDDDMVGVDVLSQGSDKADDCDDDIGTRENIEA